MAKEAVVLFHGICAPPYQMNRIEKYLRDRGYHVYSVRYPSTKKPVEDVAKDLHTQISGVTRGADKVHFVGFSLGGLLTHSYLSQYAPENLGRIVLLASPIRGSEIADLVSPYKIPQWIMGPNLERLRTDQSKLAIDFNKFGCDVGVLAGNNPGDPLSGALFPGENDGRVAVERTKFEGMKDFMVLPHSHDYFPSHDAVMYQTMHFLQHGNFDAAYKPKKEIFVFGFKIR